MTCFVFKPFKSTTTPKEKTIIRVYADPSFTAAWGPGPKLAELFEVKQGLKIQFVESQSIALVIQKIAFEAEKSNVDVVVGLDQFDLVLSAPKIEWKELKPNPELLAASAIASLVNYKNFAPFDWAPMAFVSRKNLDVEVVKLDDLLKPELKGRIALEDPRTSSAGLQFLAWVFESKGPDQGKSFLQKLNSHVHSYSSNWSTAYGLFTKKKVDIVFSYKTSPLYHILEEKDFSNTSLNFQESPPIQIEFVAVPASCKNCNAAIIFASFLQSEEAQKILMMKNYMLPLDDRVKRATPFESVYQSQNAKIKFFEKQQLQHWLQIWSQIRMQL